MTGHETTGGSDSRERRGGASSPGALKPFADRGACLVLLSSELGDQVIPLGPGATTIGRRSDRDIVIADTRVSGVHAEVVRDGSGYVLRDLGSTNGTRVNGVGIEVARLQRNDRIELGGSVTLFFTDQLLSATRADGGGSSGRRRASRSGRVEAPAATDEVGTATEAGRPSEAAPADAARAGDGSRPARPAAAASGPGADLEPARPSGRTDRVAPLAAAPAAAPAPLASPSLAPAPAATSPAATSPAAASPGAARPPEPFLTEPFMAAFAALGDDLAPLDEEDEILVRVLAFAAAHLEADRACVLPPAGAQAPHVSLAADGELTPGSPASIVQEVVAAARQERSPAATTAASAGAQGAAPAAAPAPPARRAAAASGRLAAVTLRLSRAAAAAPLHTSTGVELGVLYVDRDRPGSFFDERDLLVLGAVAATARQALQRAHRLRQLRAEAEGRAAELERLADARARLLTMAAHDLKTPLTGLLGYMEGLLVPRARDADLPTWLARELDVVVGAARGMLSLLTDLLDGDGAEAGTLAVHAEPTNLEALLQDLGSLYERWAAGAGRRVDIEVPLRLPHVRLDPHRLTQVINNLVHNAIRHTPRGGAVVVEARALGGVGAGLVEVAVSDEGPGFAPTETDRMIACFARGATVGAGKGGGHGLGLAIASRLVRRLGGELRVSGVPGQGARFAFTLPIEGPDAHEVALPAAGAGAGMRAARW